MGFFDIVLVVIIIVCEFFYIFNRKKCNKEIEGTCIENKRPIEGKKDRFQNIAKFNYRYNGKKYNEWCVDSASNKEVSYEIGKKYILMIDPNKPNNFRIKPVLDKLAICLLSITVIFIIWLIYDFIL